MLSISIERTVITGRTRVLPAVNALVKFTYQGITVTEGHGKYPVIFEPLQNVQTSR